MGLLGESGVGRGLPPAQEDSSQFWVAVSVSGQQLQEKGVFSAAPTPHTRGAGQGSWQPKLTHKWP